MIPRHRDHALPGDAIAGVPLDGSPSRRIFLRSGHAIPVGHKRDQRGGLGNPRRRHTSSRPDATCKRTIYCGAAVKQA